jgi:GST-like protein
MSGGYRLFCARGYGSMIIELAFAHAGIEAELIDIRPEDTGWNSPVLARYNPLGQLPTLILPDGRVMTESAAIILHIGDVKPDCGLVPPMDHPERPIFLRWLVMLAAAIYPTFTYGDLPTRWTDGDEAAGAKLRASTDAHRQMLFAHMDRQAASPWFLGETFSAIDYYIWQMSFWRPKRAWYEANTPALFAIARRLDASAITRAVQARNGLLK